MVKQFCLMCICSLYKSNGFLHHLFAVPIILYAVQHYLSMMGSLILMPLIIVPAMGGTKVTSVQHISMQLLWISAQLTDSTHDFLFQIICDVYRKRLLRLSLQCFSYQVWQHCSTHFSDQGYLWYKDHHSSFLHQHWQLSTRVISRV